MSATEELVRRAREFAERHRLTLGDELGHGVHGIVFATERQPGSGSPALQSAVKAHQYGPYYARERDVYLRLKEHGVQTLRGCRVPRLLAFDDALWVLEMTVVSRPFVLDFAGAYLDQAPTFSDEVLADWHAEKQEQFGPRWADAQAILRELEGYGVFMLDVNPNNVSFGD